MHLGQFSSLKFLGIGSENGKQYARLQLDIGQLFAVNKLGVLYFDTAFGLARGS